MQVGDIMRAWGMILQGQKPTLSIEITKECPLRCPGCYAFEDQHLGTGVNLRQLGDFKGDELVRRILKLADEHRPLHLSLVGGDPLVRYGGRAGSVRSSVPWIHFQLVTSAFREIPCLQKSTPCYAHGVGGRVCTRARCRRKRRLTNGFSRPSPIRE